MTLKLGELLVKKGILTQAQIEEALQTQVIFGGTLGTILIEMGLINEDPLAEILAQQLSVPCAKPGQLQNISEDVIRIISPELAEKHKVIPVSVNGRNLTLAMENPHNLKSIDEISFRTGYIVRPILALEVRLIFALENYYGIRRTIRYIAPPKQVRDELNQLHVFHTPVRRTMPYIAPPEQVNDELNQPHVFHTPDGPIVGPDTNEDLGTPGSEHVYQKPATKGEEPKHVVETPVAEPPIVEPPVIEEPLDVEELSDADLVEELEVEEISLVTTARALIKITGRDDVADAVITYLGAHYFRSALFMVVAGQVTGWRSAKGGQPVPGFDHFQLPLSEPSILKTAVESNSYFLGPVPQSGANLALTTILGKPAPATALLLPMSMLGRVVGLIYVDDASADISKAVVDVQQLASKALMAFELLILHNKILRT